MKANEAIKYLKQLYPNGGHCWLDEQRIEAIGIAVKALQEEPVELKEVDLENYNKVQKIREEVARIQLYTQSEVLKQILDYIDEVQKESVSIWHDIEELSMARECEYILVIYKDTTSPRVAGNKTQVSYWDRIDKWAYLDDLLKF